MSGLSEVIPVLQTFFVDEWTQSTLKIDAVICLIDSRVGTQLFNNQSEILKCEQNSHIEREDDVRQLFIDQLNLADVILLNKTDTVNENDMVKLKNAVMDFNDRAQLHECT